MFSVTSVWFPRKFAAQSRNNNPFPSQQLSNRTCFVSKAEALSVRSIRAQSKNLGVHRKKNNANMPPKRKADRTLAAPSSSAATGASSSGKAGNDLPAVAGYLISCDVPTKQYIQHLNDLKTQDKKFILEDLDAEHLLIKTKARAEIDAKVERWMDAVSKESEKIVLTNHTCVYILMRLMESIY